MFPRKALNLIILSILKENAEGLTGYSIVKEMKKRFGPMRVPGPGTVYPRLNKLKHKGDIIEKGNLYLISEQGKEKLTRNIPDMIVKSLELYPMLYKALMRPLSFQRRMHYLSHFPPFFGSRPTGILYDSFLPEELGCTADSTESVARLQNIKERLIKAKEQIQERMTAELEAIDEKIQLINERIKQCQEEEESRMKIPVEDGDLEGD